MAERASLLVGGLFLLIGLVFGGVGLYLWIDPAAWRLGADGRDARAELARKEIVADRTAGSMVRPRYRVHYRFLPAQGAMVSGNADIEEALWRRLGAGDVLEVRYLPGDPFVHRMEGEQRELALATVFALIGVAFVPLGAWLLRGRVPLPAARFNAWLGANPAYSLGLVGIVFFAPFGAIGIVWWSTASSEQALFDARGRQAEALVLSKAIVTRSSGSVGGSGRSGTRSTSYQVTYRFRADTGEEVLGKSSLDADVWETLKERTAVPVSYVAGSPWIHRVRGWEPGWIGPILFLAIGACGLLACGAAVWRGRGRRALAAAAPAQEAPAPAPPRQETLGAGPGRPNRGWWWGAAFGGVFFVAGVAATIEGALELLKERRYASEGRDAQGRIVEKRIDEAQRGGRGQTEYVVLYRFDTAAGAKGEGRAVLEAAAWETARPGDPIAIRYLPQEPAANRPARDGGWAYGIIISIVGPLFALVGAFIAWGSWLARRDG